MPIQALPYVLLQGLLFGSNLVVMRFGLGQLEPLTFSGLRLALASLAHTLFYLLNRQRRRRPTDPRLWRRALLLGALGTAVPSVAIVSALQYQSAGVTSTLLTTGPAITVLMAHFLLQDEALNPRKGLGVILALGGALLLTLRGEVGLPDVSQANPLGYGLVFLAMLCGSSMTIYARRFMLDFDYFDVASLRIFFATLITMPIAAFLGRIELQGVDGIGYLVLGYSSLVIALGLLLEFYNVQRFGATTAAMPLYVVPIVAGLGGVVFLDEQITTGMLVGMGLIVLGIALINRDQQVTSY